MKRACLLFLVCLSPLYADPSSLRLATWNVRNYLLQNRWQDGQYRFEYPKPEIEKATLRHTLLEVRPDVLFLQEFGSPEMLSELQEDLAASGLAYPYANYSAFPEARSGLAFLSMIPAREVLLLDPKSESERNLSGTQRGIQKVVFDINGKRLRTFHVHFKSRYTSNKDDPDSRKFRTAELAAVKALLERELLVQHANETLLLLGDFNTPFDSPMLDSIREDFIPLEVRDTSGELWTYHYYKTQALEQLDGFWSTPDHAGTFSPTGLFPLSIDRNGSDHRMVVVEWETSAPGVCGNLPD